MSGVEVSGPTSSSSAQELILTDQALQFVGALHAEFGADRLTVLRRRAERQAELDAGGTLTFASQHASQPSADWSVAPAPDDLADRRVEITGPAERKMIINALNSSANGFMACFEDALTPTWANLIDGQAAIHDAVRGTITYSAADGKHYALADDPATLHVRPRGLHLDERHLHVDGHRVAGALMDAGLFIFHNAQGLLERGSGPYLYLPKLESHLEARLWDQVLGFAEDRLELPSHSIRATVLIETLPAAFEMDQILFELRERICGLNAGRWDYIFSVIKCFRERPDMALPDRADVTMDVPFMRAYAELLVKTCHRHGAHAMGGMAALIPDRSNPAASERAFSAVRADKRREAGDGFDGTWVAHPGLVQAAREEFDAVLVAAPNQVSRQRDDVQVSAGDLLNVRIPGARATEQGIRDNISTGIQYVSSWLDGTGAVAINHLMEDAATAEISRSQLWQWVKHTLEIEGLGTLDAATVRRLVNEELAELSAPPTRSEAGTQLSQAAAVFEAAALDQPMVEFLTLPAYEVLPD